MWQCYHSESFQYKRQFNQHLLSPGLQPQLPMGTRQVTKMRKAGWVGNGEGWGLGPAGGCMLQMKGTPHSGPPALALSGCTSGCLGFSVFSSEAVCLNVIKSPNVEIPVTNAKLFQLNSLSLGVLNLTMRRLCTPLAPWATGVFFLACACFRGRISRWFCIAPHNGRSESCHFQSPFGSSSPSISGT